MSAQIREKLRNWLAKHPRIEGTVGRFLEHPVLYVAGVIFSIYLYGIIMNSFLTAIANFTHGTDEPTFSLNPIKCIDAVFTPQSFGVLLFVFIMFALIRGDWLAFITGVKITKDERNFLITSEGTHGTSGWMTKKEREKILESGAADAFPCPILCRQGGDFLGLRADSGLNKHVIVYGATGAGKSRGFVKPFILKMVQLLAAGNRQSMIIVDPKAELFEQYSAHLRENGYTVRAFNLLDMENSDGWNCIGETEGDVDMVQSVAEIIIRNTSADGDKADFWDKAEQNRAPITA